MLVPIVLGLLVAAGIGTARQGAHVRVVAKPRPSQDPPNEVKRDASPPLRSLASKPEKGRNDHQERKIPVPPGSDSPDTVRQSSLVQTSAPTPGATFDGVAAVNSLPPDPNGAVGPNNYVQIVNQSFAVYSKTGVVQYGPVTTNTLFSGFGGDCETYDDGDATVVYDRAAGRWVISQFAVSGSSYYQCVAVSKTGDPTGAYWRYAFQYNDFPDYPKLGVWPDAYYVTFNLFGFSFIGPEVCAYDRARMLSGLSATQQCYILDSQYGGMLPSDLDGATAPPAGAPNYLLNFNTNSLDLWKFHVDWTTPANSTLDGPTVIPVASFSPACNGGACIPQKSKQKKLDSLGDRLMYRLAYRNFGDHESLVVTHSVNAGTTVGIRWYELRAPNSSPPTVYQQGTYAPADSKYRWMSSAAMDGNGDIALGFSISSSSMNPSISYTGRLAGDPLGTMTQGETVLKTGAGSQTRYTRWGDYSSMSIDPSDDCTFWYTNEYLPSNGNFNWRTSIGSFKLPGCNTSSTGPPSVTTNAVSSVATTSATLNGSANPNGLATTAWFRYATVNPVTCTNSFGTATAPTSSLGSGTSSVAYPFNLTGLAASTTYYYCAIANNTAGTTAASNAPVSFTTSAAGVPPSVTTSAATGVGTTSATLNGSANPNGLATTAWFRYATVNPVTCTNSFGTATAPTSSLGSGTSSVAYPFNVTGLAASTTYYYCAIANNTAGTTAASNAPVSFTTSAAGVPPSVTTSAATGVGTTSATLNGSANPNGLATTAWFRYATVNPVTCTNSFGTATAPTSSLGSGTSSVAYPFNVTGLAASTTYYYCAIANNTAGTTAASNAPVSFTTSAAGVPPSVTTSAATGVGTTSATLNGSANPNGLATTAWFRYATVNPVTCTNSFGTATAPAGSLGSGTSSVAYPFNLTGLTASTTYYYCAIANNTAGTTAASNAPVSFTTSAVPGTSLSTTPSSVSGGANVTVSWSNVSGPTRFDWIALYHPADANTAYIDWIYDNSCTKNAGTGSLSSGSCSFKMPATVGTYQFRLLANDGYTVIATSGTVSVTVSGPSLTATPSSVSGGANVTVSWSNVASPTRLDWIALYHPADANTAFIDWIYDNNCTKNAGTGSLSSGSCSFKMPATAGTYQFRLLANDGYTVIATSGSVTVN